MSGPSGQGSTPFAAPAARDLLEAFELEARGDDVFREAHPVGAPGRMNRYGGHVTALALLAAARTLPEGRTPISFHSYFLRQSSPEEPLDLRVRRDRDGRTQSNRSVDALHGDRVVFTMQCAFGVHQDLPDWEPPPAHELPPPGTGKDRPNDQHLEIRAARDDTGGHPWFWDRMWVRPAGPVPTDPLGRAVVLAYICDLGSGFSFLHLPGLDAHGPTITHSTWFHHVPEPEGWVSMDLEPAKVHGGRGLYHGELRAVDGRLAATVAQEMLLRPHVAKAPDPTNPNR